MSDTPRTDKEIVGELLVFASFARKLERELTAVTEQRDRLAEALLWAKKEHDARIAMFAYDGPVISAEYERLGMHLMEVKHNATITRESALAAWKEARSE
jgi:hypothetical protein